MLKSLKSSKFRYKIDLKFLSLISNFCFRWNRLLQEVESTKEGSPLDYLLPTGFHRNKMVETRFGGWREVQGKLCSKHF